MAKKSNSKNKPSIGNFPTLKIVNEVDIATDFARKVYEKFDKLIKSVVLFGSTVKKETTSGSDIDIIIIVDDASVQFDTELVGWYREELGKIIAANPYKRELHINTIKLTTWWDEMLRGDPVVTNIIRYGEEILDFGGFFRPLRILLQQGRIRPTPEAIYTCLQRAPLHLVESKRAELASIEGIYWAMVDSSHAVLIAAKIPSPSPEHIPILLKENFADKGLLDIKYINWYREVYALHKGIEHGDVKDVRGQNIDDWHDRAQRYIGVMAELINKIIK